MEDYIVVIILIIVFIVIPYIIGKIDDFKNSALQKELNIRKEYEKRESEIRNEVANFKKEIEQHEKQMNAQFVLREKEIDNKIFQNLKIKNEIKNICDDSQDSPWLAERLADYHEMLDGTIEKQLKIKKNPALKASQIISEIKKEKRQLIKENKQMQYQLSFLKNNFPMIEDAMQLNSTELVEALNSIYNQEEKKEDYEILKEYLSPEEYEKLSECEKYQLALDRFQNKKKKSLWQIGISYERYIGYIYESKNYDVIYNGAIEKKGDLGRDIIAENKEEILIIQCKYWRKENVVRENAIFQLYGTMILKQLETSKPVKGILVTTTTLSPEAKKIAKYLNIQVRENEIFDKSYPCIKCNINKDTGEKIYHLPFDQQYDKVKINLKKGESYVSTTREAEELGFRKAKKHIQSI